MNTEVQVCLMGPAKQFHPEGRVSLHLENGTTIAALRDALAHWITEKKLDNEMLNILSRSVFADTKKILREEDMIQGGSEYVLIPPISGG